MKLRLHCIRVDQDNSNVALPPIFSRNVGSAPNEGTLCVFGSLGSSCGTFICAFQLWFIIRV